MTLGFLFFKVQHLQNINNLWCYEKIEPRSATGPLPPGPPSPPKTCIYELQAIRPCPTKDDNRLYKVLPDSLWDGNPITTAQKIFQLPNPFLTLSDTQIIKIFYQLSSIKLNHILSYFKHGALTKLQETS